MCQVTPFTLPCCRRIYVYVEKLPSCPETWPKSKCPPELCIQLGGYEAKDAEHKAGGICWRCTASMSGAVGYDRERGRPEIDKAMVVIGLVELGPADRRRLVEADGICWFCSAKGDCDTCGAKEINIGLGYKKGTVEKRHGNENDNGNWKAPNKRPRIENAVSMSQAPSSISPNTIFQSSSQNTSQQPFHNTVGPFVRSDGTSSLTNYSPLHAEISSPQSNIDPALLQWQPTQNQNGFQSVVYSDPIFGSRATQGYKFGGGYKDISNSPLLGPFMQVLGAGAVPFQIKPAVQDEDLEFARTLETYNSNFLNFESSYSPMEEEVSVLGIQTPATSPQLM